MRKAVVKQSNGFVVNVIEWEEGSLWQLPKDCILIDALNASPGDTWNGASFIKPEVAPPEPVRDIFAEIDDLKARIEKLGKK